MLQFEELKLRLIAHEEELANLADALDAEEINKAIGGEAFCPWLAALKDDIKCNMSLNDMLVYGKSMLKIDLKNGIYTCTMPTMFTNVDAHLYQDRTETDKIIEKYFYDDGPIVGNDPYEAEEDTTNN